MKLESTFKYFCFVFAAFILWLIYADLAAGKTAFSDYLGNIGLFLICIEMAVLMTHEKLTAEVSLKNFFSKGDATLLSPVGVFARVLGKIGVVLLAIDLVMKFL